MRALRLIAALSAILLLGERLVVAGVLMVCSPTTHEVLRYDSATGEYLGVFAAADDGLDYPVDLTVGPDGSVYVANHFASVLRFDGDTGAFLGQIVPQGHYHSILVGPNNQLLVNRTSDIARYDATTGAFLGSFGSFGNADGTVIGPDGYLYVTDWGSGNIYRFDVETGNRVENTFISLSPTAVSGKVAFGPDGLIYVAIWGGHQIRRYDSNGNFVDVFASGYPQLNLPGGIDFGPDGNLYVANTGANEMNIGRYDIVSGAYLGNFTGGGGGPLTGFAAGFVFLEETNLAPVAHAGDDQTVPCTANGKAVVQLDGSLSYDPDGDDLEYEWSAAEGSGVIFDDAGAAVTAAHIPVGVHELTLSVYDLDDNGARRGEVGVDSVIVIVVDKTPPVVLVTTDVAALWAPNNKMVPVNITVQASDACTNPADLLLQCTITSSQPDGKSPHAGDVNGHDGYSNPVSVTLTYTGNGEYRALVYLRAERDGNDKAGRVYSINVYAIDDSNNMGQASTAVIVPHDQRKK